MYAAKAGNIDIIEKLVQHKADVDARNKEQSTALSLATRAGQHNAIAVLAAAGADVSINLLIIVLLLHGIPYPWVDLV